METAWIIMLVGGGTFALMAALWLIVKAHKWKYLHGRRSRNTRGKPLKP